MNFKVAVIAMLYSQDFVSFEINITKYGLTCIVKDQLLQAILRRQGPLDSFETYSLRKATLGESLTEQLDVNDVCEI